MAGKTFSNLRLGVEVSNSLPRHAQALKKGQTRSIIIMSGLVSRVVWGWFLGGFRTGFKVVSGGFRMAQSGFRPLACANRHSFCSTQQPCASGQVALV